MKGQQRGRADFDIDAFVRVIPLLGALANHKERALAEVYVESRSKEGRRRTEGELNRD